MAKRFIHSTQRHRILGMLVLSVWVLSLASAHAARYHVVVSGGSDANDGLGWGTALATISNAMVRVSDGDTVMLSNGTFNITAQIDLTNAVTFTSTNGWEYTTVDAGNIVDRRVFYMTNENAVIDGITITRGYSWIATLPDDSKYNGGGVWMSAGRLQNCNVSNNVCWGIGANVYISGGSVSNCVLAKGTSSKGSGAGVGIEGASAVVEYCTIRGNNAYGAGSGVYIGVTGGTVRNCPIEGNLSNYQSGGGVKLDGGVIENCLVVDNRNIRVSPSGTGGGGIYLVSGEVRFCTVADNEGAGTGAGIYASGGIIKNTIVYHNTSTDSGSDEDLINSGGATVTWSCAPELTNGTGNVIGNPEFEDRSADNYRLAPASSCIDSGTNIVGISVDLEGFIRPQDGEGVGTAVEDMGCYEAAPVTGGVFRCNFTAPTTEAVFSLNAQFTAITYGSQTNGLYYWWDYDNDGNVDEEGPDKRIVTTNYSAGTYSVSLTVSNDNNDVTNRIKTFYITVYTNHTYVSTNGSHDTPFATWATAATNIQDAIDGVMTGGIVTVSNGEYAVTEQIRLDKAVTVESVAGADETIVKLASGDSRISFLGDPLAVLDGFTLADGRFDGAIGNGAGIYMTAGTVKNCIVTNCFARGHGPGIYMTGGTVTNCTVVKCFTGDSHNSLHGGGINMSAGLVVDSDILKNHARREGSGLYMSGGEVLRCRIRGNTYSPFGYGAALYIQGAGTVRNCLITENIGGNDGGGIYMNHADARVENCTIVDNDTLGDGGGIKCQLGTVTNCIVHYNTLSASGEPNDIAGTAGTNNVRYSCSPDLTDDPAGTGNITTVPGFMDRNNDDFTLDLGSACIDTGTNLTNVVYDIDRAVRPQDGDNDGTNTHDMGCYEAADFGSGPLRCNFSALTNEAPISLTAWFTAVVAGANTNNLYYWWDFDNDGSDDDEGFGKGTVSHPYVAGFYTVRLTVSNIAAEVASKTLVEYIKVFPTTTYVATNGAHVNPYSTWVTAATNIQDAVDAAMAGGTVWVSNGTYLVNASIALAKAVTVRSVNGAGETVVRLSSGDARILGIPFTLVDSGPCSRSRCMTQLCG